MIEKSIIAKIKRACLLYGGNLIDRWDDGTITDESIERAYSELILRTIKESSDVSVSGFCSRCAIICYQMAVKNGEL